MGRGRVVGCLGSVRLLTERFCAKPLPACQKLALSLYRAWVSALLAGVLFLASPRKSSQKEGDPRLRGWLRQLPCATRRSGRLAKLACGSDNASRLPPALLRCSALHMGARKAGWFKQQRNYSAATVNREKRQKMKVARRDAMHPTSTQPPSLPRRREPRQRMDSRLRALLYGINSGFNLKGLQNLDYRAFEVLGTRNSSSNLVPSPVGEG